MNNTQNTVRQMYTPSFQGGKIHIESEVILPDYCPEMAKTVKTDVIPKITSFNCYHDGDTLNADLDGTALFKVLYLAKDDAGLCSTFFTQPFSHSFKIKIDGDTDSENLFDCVSLSAESASCRPSSAGKAVIKGDIAIIPHIRLNCVREFSDGGDGDFCVKGESLPVCSLITSGEADFTISEKITLPENLPSAEDITDCGIRYVCDGVKTADGKVIFNATAFFTCFYRAESGMVSFCQPIELSQIMDLPETESTHRAEAYFIPTSLRADVDVDNYGENRIIAVDFSYTARVAVYGNTLFYAVTDVFSPEYDFSAEYAEQSLRAFEGKAEEQVSVKGSLKLKIPETVSLENLCPSVRLRGWVAENGTVSADGRLNLKMIAVLPSGYEGIEESLDFTAKIPLENPEADKCELTAEVREVDLVLSENSIEVSAEVTIIARTFTSRTVKCVKQLTKGEKKSPLDRPPMILYYPSEEETVWDVAKKYSVFPKDLCLANGFDGDKITEAVVKIPKRQ